MLATLATEIACGDEPNVHEDTGGSSSGFSDTTTSIDPGPDASDTASSDPSTTTDSSGPGERPSCTEHADCSDAAAPICVAETCVACDAAADPDGVCAEVDPARRVCAEGVCVECTADVPAACGATTPVCDTDSNVCVACDDHGQCPDSACNLPTGACLPAGNVIHVHGDGGRDATTVSSGLGMLGNRDGVLVLHEASISYNGPASITNGTTIAIVAAPGQSPRWVQTAGGAPTLSVTSGSVALLGDLDIRGNANSEALHLDAASAWVQRYRVVQNYGGGITAAFASDLHVENSFVDGDVDVDAVDIATSTVDIVYSTLGANFGASSALTCNATSTVDIRNSILMSRSSDPEVQCSPATLVDSATETDVGDVVTTWFSDYNGGDFSLSASGASTFAGLATWKTGDPLTDIDGELRSGIDGTPEHAGADLP